VLGYLDNTIYPIRRRWAFCFRIGILTLGINSTQRCEGYFSLLKAELVKLGTLTHLLETLKRITHKNSSEDAIYMAATNRALDVAMKEVDPALRTMYSSLLDVVQQDGTLHCLKRLVREVVAAPRFHVELAAPDGRVSGDVKFHLLHLSSYDNCVRHQHQVYCNVVTVTHTPEVAVVAMLRYHVVQRHMGALEQVMSACIRRICVQCMTLALYILRSCYHHARTREDNGACHFTQHAVLDGRLSTGNVNLHVSHASMHTQ
jgi:hypothetical protein